VVLYSAQKRGKLSGYGEEFERGWEGGFRSSLFVEYSGNGIGDGREKGTIQAGAWEPITTFWGWRGCLKR